MSPSLKPKSVPEHNLPLVIAHRGASGHLPEHTLAAYRLGIEQGADYIEPDLVMTKDGVLVARHENEISETTDVADRFPDRKTTKVVDGHRVSGWFVEDFTLKELRQLRARERLPYRNQDNNGKFPVPTFAEILELVRNQERAVGRIIGVYPELKHPTYFAGLGLNLEDAVLTTLKAYDREGKDKAVFIQCFEVSPLRRLARKTSTRLIQLIGEADGMPYDLRAQGITYREMMTVEGLNRVAQYASGIGPWKGFVTSESALVQRAHEAGLLVHVYTLRNDPQNLPSEFAGQPQLEVLHYLRLGVDGVFSDFPATAVRARQEWQK